jgi:chondroitin AC lyase
MNKLIIFLTLAFFFLINANTLQAQSQDDLVRVKQRIVAFQAEMRGLALKQNFPPPVQEAEVQGWIKTLGSDGSWPDIDYASQARSGWPTMEHLRRLSIMASIFAGTKIDGHPDAGLRATVTKVFDFWLNHTPHSANWWHNEIGAPNILTDTMLVLEDTLTADEKAKGLKLTDESADLNRTGKNKMTGQNLVWCAAIAFKNALLMNDTAGAKQERDIIASELRETTAEGLQYDQSFHQHGSQFQMGNYGLSFMVTISNFAWFWRGTSFELDEEKLSHLRRFMLEGETLVVTNKAMDISSCGRQLTPHSPLFKGSAVIRQLGLMAKVDEAHASDYLTAIAQDSAATGCGDPALPGGRLDKLFYRSDYLVHRRPDFFASVKLNSKRVQGGENTNQENQLGRFLADGALFVYHDGSEYADIFPVWDWRKIPGVTCASQGKNLIPAEKMDTDFAGAVSDGTYGAAGLDYNRDGVTGRKSWFFLDHEIVCLGAGLTARDNSTLTTDIEQCLLKGDVIAGKIGKPGAVQPASRHEASGTNWVWHNGRGYVLPGKQNIVLGGATQSGSWHDVLISGNSAPISKDVFSLWIDHGVRPPAAGYVYMILPVSTKEETAAWAGAPLDTVLSNTPGVQAIENARLKLAMAVFFQPGRITCQLGTMTVDAPCALILNEDAAHPRVTVADPSQLGTTVHVTLGGKSITVNLPQLEEAGKSISADWK